MQNRAVARGRLVPDHPGACRVRPPPAGLHEGVSTNRGLGYGPRNKKALLIRAATKGASNLMETAMKQ